ncbi:MAG: hypothetical protein SV765_05755 [Pseudomonadota bacterium]|nr:hypothetical protein [Pseudomonadota bacterium]
MTLKTIYFHVGTVKTGSTTIQKMLWKNKDLLKSFGVTYMDLVPPKLSYHRYANAEFLMDPDVEVSQRELEGYLKTLDTENLVISEEGLWMNMALLNSLLKIT